MPPRKRTRHSTASSPLPPSLKNTGNSSAAASPAPTNATLDKAAQDEEAAAATAALLADPWTDEEETALFRAIIRHKPTGLHKHMAMLNIYTSLLSQGYVQEGYPTPVGSEAGDGKDQDTNKDADAESGRHMSIKGIWKKLNELYDLEALDAREQELDYEMAFGANSDAEDSDEEEEEQPAPTRRSTRRGTTETEERETSLSPAPIGREFQLPSASSSRSASPTSSIKREEGHTTFSSLMWTARFPSPTPSATNRDSSPASPTAAPKGRRGRQSTRPKTERRDSSPAVLPDLLSSRHDPAPVHFTPSKELRGDVEGSVASARSTATPVPRGGRGRGRGRGGARGGRASDFGGRRSSRQVEAVQDSEDAEEEEEEEGSGEEGEDEDEAEEGSSSEEVDTQETPQKRRPGRPAGTGRGRGRGSGRGTTARGRGRK